MDRPFWFHVHSTNGSSYQLAFITEQAVKPQIKWPWSRCVILSEVVELFANNLARISELIFLRNGCSVVFHFVVWFLAIEEQLSEVSCVPTFQEMIVQILVCCFSMLAAISREAPWVLRFLSKKFLNCDFNFLQFQALPGIYLLLGGLWSSLLYDGIYPCFA